jgi:hypothetical protein
MQDKYKMFSNYMHNELGITKEDIRDWIKEAVEEIAFKMCKNEFDNFDPATIVKRVLYREDLYNSSSIKDQIKAEIAQQLLSKFEFGLRVKKEEVN